VLVCILGFTLVKGVNVVRGGWAWDGIGSVGRRIVEVNE
jgi:hypothetical protein